jgi:hypothetical protein
MKTFADHVNVSRNVVVIVGVDEVVNHFSDIVLVTDVSAEPGSHIRMEGDFEIESPGLCTMGCAVCPVANTDLPVGDVASASRTNKAASCTTSAIRNFR